MQTPCVSSVSDHRALLSLLCLPSDVHWLSSLHQHIRFAGASAQASPLLIWLALWTSPDPFQFLGLSQLSWIKLLDILSLFCSLGKTQRMPLDMTYWYLWTLPVISFAHSTHSVCILLYTIDHLTSYKDNFSQIMVNWEIWALMQELSTSFHRYKMEEIWFTNTSDEVSLVILVPSQCHLRQHVPWLPLAIFHKLH